MREFLLFYCCIVEHSRRHWKFAWQKITILIFFSQNRYQDFRENLLETVLKEVDTRGGKNWMKGIQCEWDKLNSVFQYFLYVWKVSFLISCHCSDSTWVVPGTCFHQEVMCILSAETFRIWCLIFHPCSLFMLLGMEVTHIWSIPLHNRVTTADSLTMSWLDLQHILGKQGVSFCRVSPLEFDVVLLLCVIVLQNSLSWLIQHLCNNWH